MDEKKKIEIKPVLVTTDTLAAVFDMAEKYLSELHLKHGMPKHSHDKWNLIDCLMWRIRYNDHLHKKEIDKIKSERAQDLNARKNAEFKDLLIKEKTKDLIDRVEVETQWVEKTKVIIANIDGFPGKIAPLMLSRTNEKEIIEVLNDEIINLKNRIANTKLDIAAPAETEFN